MHINPTLRRVIPICSMLLALGTVAFQTMENTSKKEELEKKILLEKNQLLEVDMNLLKEEN